MSQANEQISAKLPLLSPTATIRVDGARPVDAAQAKRGFLTLIRGRADIGTHLLVEGRAVIGRDPGCEFTLLDHQVSRRHAVVMPISSNQFLIQDLGSTNGTHVGGQTIAGPQPLHDGDRIVVGESVIRFSLGDEIDARFQTDMATLVGSDPLTGLPSKRRFDDAFEFALHTARRAGDPLALLMMDLDGVKPINDTHGHLFGAHVIGEAGRCIARQLSHRAIACRFGGDEFSAILPGQDPQAAIQTAERIRVAIETAGLQKDGIALRPTISIGVACFPDSASELLDLVARADAALYRAKARGKNCVAT